MSTLATRQQLADLLRLVTQGLHAILKSDKPTAEALQVARKLLDANHVRADGVRARRRLEALYAAYVRELAKAVEERPTAAILAECRHFLASQHVSKEAPIAASLQQLASSALPFTKPH
ncbi:hypothetical protein [Piscinibacterium candidicorallinum]|uniref:Uncharacterized protein n=1 Tax=Piscinibacterium candidicorallinum TaxID=1793872 RepID=A0ABV7H2C5_9BURK